MVSISASSRQNLLALLDTQKQTDMISAKMVEGKRVLSVSDNAFSFYQAKSFDDRQANLTAVNDKVGIALKTLTSADKGAKGIKTELSKLEGLLKDLTTSSASNATTFQANGPANLGTAAGNTTATSIFNRTGSVTAPIDQSAALVESVDEISTAASIFKKANTTGTTALNAQVGAAAAATDLKTDDTLGFTIGAKTVFVKVVNAATTVAIQTNQTGENAANAVSVFTVNDLVNALNGKAINGTTSLAATAQFNEDDNVAAAFNVTNGLMLSTSNGAARTVSLNRTTSAADTDASGIFGGAKGTFATPTSTTTTQAAVAAGTAQFLQGDIVRVKVGDTSGGGTQQSLFLKVVKNFSGTSNAQQGDGLSSAPGVGSTGALEVRTIGDIVNALNGRKSDGSALTGFSWGAGNSVSASFDASTSQFKVPTVGNTTEITAPRFSLNSSTKLEIAVGRVGLTAGALSQNIFGGTSTIITGTNGGPASNSVFTAQLTSAATEKRTSVARVFQASLEQIDNLTNDATFGGNNLLNSAAGFNVDLSDATSAATASKFQVKLSGATDAVSLGFAAKVGGVYQDGAQSNFNTNALVNGALVKTQNALARLEGRQVEIDSLTDSLKTRSDFNNTVKSSLGSASSDLTALDQAEATAQAQAISFGNSVATKFLGTIAQRSQQLLQLF